MPGKNQGSGGLARRDARKQSRTGVRDGPPKRRGSGPVRTGGPIGGSWGARMVATRPIGVGQAGQPDLLPGPPDRSGSGCPSCLRLCPVRPDLIGVRLSSPTHFRSEPAFSRKSGAARRPPSLILRGCGRRRWLVRCQIARTSVPGEEIHSWPAARWEDLRHLRTYATTARPSAWATASSWLDSRPIARSRPSRLVARHGPMVLATCRAVLNTARRRGRVPGHLPGAGRQARSVRAGDALGGWLHRVAYRVAVQAGAEVRRRRRREAEAAMMTLLSARRSPSRSRDDRARGADPLPDRYRLPVVLCDLEGLTNAKAAGRLHWTEPTLRHRLLRARRRLRERLIRRGITAGAVGVVLAASTAGARRRSRSLGLAAVAAVTGVASGGRRRPVGSPHPEHAHDELEVAWARRRGGGRADLDRGGRGRRIMAPDSPRPAMGSQAGGR